MNKHISRRKLLQAGSLLGVGALAACDQVEFPGLATAERAAAPCPTPAPTETAATPSAPTPLTETPPAEPASPDLATASTPQVREATTASGYRYEVERTEADWRAQLSEADYKILREGGTEPRNSSPLTTEARSGTYACKGCALPIYSSRQKVILPQGWVFFSHSYPDAVLTGIDTNQIEVHCRRCASHLGHMLFVDNQIVHCINGSALDFTAIG